jgi:hypothetical protein
MNYKLSLKMQRDSEHAKRQWTCKQTVNMQTDSEHADNRSLLCGEMGCMVHTLRWADNASHPHPIKTTPTSHQDHSHIPLRSLLHPIRTTFTSHQDHSDIPSGPLLPHIRTTCTSHQDIINSSLGTHPFFIGTTPTSHQDHTYIS